MEKGKVKDNGDLLSSIVDQRIKNLFKILLSEIETIRLENFIMLDKVKAKTDDSFASDINYMNEKKFENIRKRILDEGNDCIREIDTAISSFDCNFNQEKFDEIQKSKKIIKKFFSPVTYEK